MARIQHRIRIGDPTQPVVAVVRVARTSDGLYLVRNDDFEFLTHADAVWSVLELSQDALHAVRDGASLELGGPLVLYVTETAADGRVRCPLGGMQSVRFNGGDSVCPSPSRFATSPVRPARRKSMMQLFAGKAEIEQFLAAGDPRAFRDVACQSYVDTPFYWERKTDEAPPEWYQGCRDVICGTDDPDPTIVLLALHGDRLGTTTPGQNAHIAVLAPSYARQAPGFQNMGFSNHAQVHLGDAGVFNVQSLSRRLLSSEQGCAAPITGDPTSGRFGRHLRGNAYSHDLMQPLPAPSMPILTGKWAEQLANEVAGTMLADGRLVASLCPPTTEPVTESVTGPKAEPAPCNTAPILGQRRALLSFVKRGAKGPVRRLFLGSMWSGVLAEYTDAHLAEHPATEYVEILLALEPQDVAGPASLVVTIGGQNFGSWATHSVGSELGKHVPEEDTPDVACTLDLTGLEHNSDIEWATTYGSCRDRQTHYVCDDSSPIRRASGEQVPDVEPVSSTCTKIRVLADSVVEALNEAPTATAPHAATPPEPSVRLLTGTAETSGLPATCLGRVVFVRPEFADRPLRYRKVRLARCYTARDSHAPLFQNGYFATLTATGAETHKHVELLMPEDSGHRPLDLGELSLAWGQTHGCRGPVVGLGERALPLDLSGLPGPEEGLGYPDSAGQVYNETSPATPAADLFTPTAHLFTGLPTDGLSSNEHCLLITGMSADGAALPIQLIMPPDGGEHPKALYALGPDRELLPGQLPGPPATRAPATHVPESALPKGCVARWSFVKPGTSGQVRRLRLGRDRDSTPCRVSDMILAAHPEAEYVELYFATNAADASGPAAVSVAVGEKAYGGWLTQRASPAAYTLKDCTSAEKASCVALDLSSLRALSDSGPQPAVFNAACSWRGTSWYSKPEELVPASCLRDVPLVDESCLVLAAFGKATLHEAAAVTEEPAAPAAVEEPAAVAEPQTCVGRVSFVLPDAGPCRLLRLTTRGEYILALTAETAKRYPHVEVVIPDKVGQGVVERVTLLGPEGECCGGFDFTHAKRGHALAGFKLKAAAVLDLSQVCTLTEATGVRTVDGYGVGNWYRGMDRLRSQDDTVLPTPSAGLPEDGSVLFLAASNDVSFEGATIVAGASGLTLLPAASEPPPQPVVVEAADPEPLQSTQPALSVTLHAADGLKRSDSGTTLPPESLRVKISGSPAIAPLAAPAIAPLAAPISAPSALPAAPQPPAFEKAQWLLGLLGTVGLRALAEHVERMQPKRLPAAQQQKALPKPRK